MADRRVAAPPPATPPARDAPAEEEDPATLLAGLPPTSAVCVQCDPDSSPPPALVAAFSALLRAIGEDPSREGLRLTPERAARALRFLTSGYALCPRDVVGDAKFVVDVPSCGGGGMEARLPGGRGMGAPLRGGGGMVVVRDIELHSLCEHHLLPFHGRVHVGYLPGAVVLGLSKLARITQIFARRLQIQERLTQQIAAALMDEIQPRGVAVVVECLHMCMAMRGVEQRAAVTTTNAMQGAFADDPSLRQEFWSSIRTPRSML
ncbi:hypothetical protein AB1Y20_000114 [Prymnesium parvum]|uniref:GTP cyclohydrolase 1 n=1 Tax=Prymnesium parvum TaxID=97485 RepID=A0AB34K4H3_PRYPA